MTRLILPVLLALALMGCAVPTVIPTGNPLTDMLVNTALMEAARPVIAGEAGPLLAKLAGEPECVRGRSGVLYCGRW